MEAIMTCALCFSLVVNGFMLGRLTAPKTPCKEYKVNKVVKSPVKAYQEHKQTKEEQKELERLNTIMNNIENYDGTGAYQKDVPK